MITFKLWVEVMIWQSSLARPSGREKVKELTVGAHQGPPKVMHGHDEKRS